eukprot:s3132_g3.t1
MSGFSSAQQVLGRDTRVNREGRDGKEQELDRTGQNWTKLKGALPENLAGLLRGPRASAMADDLDFDAVEQLLDNADRAANADFDDERRKKRRSRTRSRSARRGRSRSRSREARRLEKEREMEEKRRQEEEEERRRQIEDATRGDRTVMIVCLHHKADERDVYEFFSKNAGKVRDVQIIRDARTGRSKGLAYVEFYLQEATLKALALSGQPIKGQAVRVQPSQAEKNRAAQAAKASIHYTAPRETPLRLYVGGLTDSLANISEEELKKLFSPFGEIEFIDLHRDPYTNKCKGFAFVQFKNASEAREAMTAMNGFQLAGKELKVGIATSDMQLGEGGQGANLAIGENLHEDRKTSTSTAPSSNCADSQDASTMGPNAQPGMLKDANDRLALMQKLQRDPTQGYGPGVPSNIIVLHGMFNPSQVNLAADPEFFNDIHADVEQEQQHGRVCRSGQQQGRCLGEVCRCDQRIQLPASFGQALVRRPANHCRVQHRSDLGRRCTLRSLRQECMYLVTELGTLVNLATHQSALPRTTSGRFSTCDVLSVSFVTLKVILWSSIMDYVDLEWYEKIINSITGSEIQNWWDEYVLPLIDEVGEMLDEIDPLKSCR